MPLEENIAAGWGPDTMAVPDFEKERDGDGDTQRQR